MHGTDSSTANSPGAPDDPGEALAGLGADGRPFALLYRPGSVPDARVEVLTGEVQAVGSLAELPLPEGPAGGARHDLLVAVPYRQITERGFACRDDRAPLLAMRVARQTALSRDEALAGLPDQDIRVSDAGFDISDEEYAATVRRVLSEEIGQGAGSNFVIRRSFTARLDDCSVRTELAVFRRLLTGELGSHWTFLFHTGAGTFIGASPEAHVGMAAGTVSMNPISGTYRHPATGPETAGLLKFLNDQKEANELYMVVDEELKMMARMCATGGRVHGPFLKEMARLTHSEYILTGDSDHDVRDVLRETLLAPTVTGSPLENAFRVIARHETTGRGHYGGVLALIGRDATDDRTLDSAIMIRTAEIDDEGRLRLGVGATLVRDSDPESEVAETRAKAAGMLEALGLASPGGAGGRPVPAGAYASPAADPQVRRALLNRNATLSRFWLAGAQRGGPDPALDGRRVLLVDNEDTFMGMLGHQLRALGLTTTITRFDRPLSPEEYDLVVVGPGPGDPRDTTSPRLNTLRALTRDLLAGSVPFLSICLGHQVLASELGFELVRRTVPNQGVQKRINLFGQDELVGYYNTYTARSEYDFVAGTGWRKPVEVSRQPGTGEVHALRGTGFRSVQFHLESVLTQHGPRILRDLLVSLLGEAGDTGFARVYAQHVGGVR
ncbi:anthranilate synthase family protein [Streptomyces sp. NK15101]|uniref:anthranilate synthase family protein n=1 Tax=Streptomyces sp. NK15101 TaxID=2873261 RepID=UPI001CEC09B8|nr:anthranilate synthase family protein [Streptomyces sp. NK15101]